LNLKKKDMKNINIPHELNKIDIADLHTAFKKLKIDVAPAKPGTNEMDDATRAGISKFQEQAGLRVNGRLTSETVTRLNAELEHIFYRYISQIELKA
jgi:peptidoglycan hydrolase-like protein with peptidoglycan-binding domain